MQSHAHAAVWMYMHRWALAWPPCRAIANVTSQKRARETFHAGQIQSVVCVNIYHYSTQFSRPTVKGLGIQPPVHECQLLFTRDPSSQVFAEDSQILDGQLVSEQCSHQVGSSLMPWYAFDTSRSAS